jgi:hypothetical protein
VWSTAGAGEVGDVGEVGEVGDVGDVGEVGAWVTVMVKVCWNVKPSASVT